LLKEVDDIAWLGYDGGSNIQDFCNKTLKLIDQEDYIGIHIIDQVIYRLSGCIQGSIKAVITYFS
jgi:hypothetical protein